MRYYIRVNDHRNRQILYRWRRGMEGWDANRDNCDTFDLRDAKKVIAKLQARDTAWERDWLEYVLVEAV